MMEEFIDSLPDGRKQDELYDAIQGRGAFRRVHLGEKIRRICGLSNRAEIVNPTDDDVEKAIKILIKFRNI